MLEEKVFHSNVLKGWFSRQCEKLSAKLKNNETRILKNIFLEQITMIYAMCIVGSWQSLENKEKTK